MIAEAIPETWDAAAAKKLQAAGLVFLHLPDGSPLALLQNAVVLLDSAGDRRTVASSLEAVFHAWSRYLAEGPRRKSAHAHFQHPKGHRRRRKKTLTDRTTRSRSPPPETKNAAAAEAFEKGVDGRKGKPL